MLFFELVLILITTLYFILNKTIKTHIKPAYLLSLLVVVLVLQLVFNGYRWQMIPAYIIWLIALISALKGTGKKPRLIFSLLKSLGILILVSLSLALPLLLPVFELPQTRGSYKVGTHDMCLELEREEGITADKTDKRRLMIKAWYPSNETNENEDPYIDAAGRKGFAQKYGLAPAMLNYLEKVKTEVYRDVAIAPERFPVLIFSHGYNSKANGYYALIKEWVSQGYIVLGINHTYESTGSSFPEGNEAYFDYAYAAQIEAGSWEKIQPAIQTFREGIGFEARTLL